MIGVRPGLAPGLARPWGRRIQWRHPQWWVAGVAAAAWVVLALGQGVGGAASPGDAHAHPLYVELGAFAIMTVAMMVPLVLPTLRHVALCSLWPRRHRAMLVFLAGFLGVWTLVGGAIVLARAAISSLVGDLATLGVAAALATAWQLSPARRRQLRRCERTVPLRPRGRAADLDCARFGLAAGWSCVTTCWALMAMSVAGHSMVVMVVISSVQLGERLVRRDLRRPAVSIVGGLGTGLVFARLLGVTG